MDIGFYEKKLERIQEWIKNADDKASIFLAFEGVVATFALPYLFKVVTICNPINILFCGGTLAFLFLSIWKSLQTIIPDTTISKGKKSLTFFGDIASQQFDDYEKHVKGCCEDDYKDDLIKQCHICATVTVNKLRNLKYAINYFSISAVFALLTIISFYIW